MQLAMRALLALVVGALALAGQGSAAPVVIEGAPQTGWAVRHFNQTADCLYSGLAAMGAKTTYDELMVASGYAFRMAWWPGWYSYMAPEVVPEDLIAAGAEAAGGGAQRVDHPSVDEAWVTTCRSLDDGCPVLARNGCAYRLICGYDPQGRVMYTREYHSQKADYDVKPFDVTEPPWPEKGGREVIILAFDPKAAPPDLDWPKILDRAIRFADWPADRKLNETFVFGLSAYDAWAATLREGPDKNGVNTDVELNDYMCRTIGEARACAGRALQQYATIHGSLDEAGTLYAEEAQLFDQLSDVLRGGVAGSWAEMQEAMRANFALPEVREQAAQIIEQAKALDSQAVDCLRTALADLQAKPEEKPPPVVTGTPADDKAAAAAEHLTKGRALKDARQFAEAAEELWKAIEADPKLAEAQWVLGWVLIELKDNDGAKAAFRKVVELAPGTERATEAQKAMERLR
jgi:tetratricopeptide (TPR) repeat protein